MNDKKNRTGVQTIGCDVKDCRYHCDPGCCTAVSIRVENETAQHKGETFCATFENRTQC